MSVAPDQPEARGDATLRRHGYVVFYKIRYALPSENRPAAGAGSCLGATYVFAGVPIARYQRRPIGADALETLATVVEEVERAGPS